MLRNKVYISLIIFLLPLVCLSQKSYIKGIVLDINNNPIENVNITSTSKELKFTEGYMVKYHENFDATGKNPMSEAFVISAKSIAMGNGEHVNEWV